MTVHNLDIRPAAQVAGTASQGRARRRLPWGAMLLGLALLLSAAGAAWWFLRPVEVRAARIETGEAVDAIYASGVIEYVRQARVAPVVTAPIRKVYVEEGDNVRPGQILAQLDDGPQQGVTLQLEALAAQARAVASRARRLYDAGFGAKAADEDAQAQRVAAEAAAGGARAHLRDFQLVAPFAGQVLRRDAEPGDLASVGQPKFVIADLKSLRVTADVDERDVGQLASGMEALVRADAFAGRVFKGRISEITPQGDSTGRVFRVRIALPADTPLKPGMTVETNLVTARRPQATLAPTAALSKGGVFVIASGKAYWRKVTTGAAGADRTEITKGLKAGEAVVLSPPDRLRDGSRVAIATP